MYDKATMTVKKTLKSVIQAGAEKLSKIDNVSSDTPEISDIAGELQELIGQTDTDVAGMYFDSVVDYNIANTISTTSIREMEWRQVLKNYVATEITHVLRD